MILCIKISCAENFSHSINGNSLVAICRHFAATSIRQRATNIGGIKNNCSSRRQRGQPFYEPEISIAPHAEKTIVSELDFIGWCCLQYLLHQHVRLGKVI